MVGQPIVSTSWKVHGQSSVQCSESSNFVLCNPAAECNISLEVYGWDAGLFVGTIWVAKGSGQDKAGIRAIPRKPNMA